MSSVAHLALLQRQRRVRDLPQLRRLLSNARAMRAAVATALYSDFARLHAPWLVGGYDAAKARAVAQLCVPKAVRCAHPLVDVQVWLALLLRAALTDAFEGTRDELARHILRHQIVELQCLAAPNRQRRSR